MYKSMPWTLSEKPVKNSKAKSNATNLFFKEIKKEEEIAETKSSLKIKKDENLPISVSRIVKFLNKNKDKSFTNSQIAKETGISVGLISGITDKLEGIGIIQPGLRKAVGKNTVQTYQSALANSGKIPKERVGGKEVIEIVQEIFNKNRNKVHTKNEIANELEETKDKVGQAISILLITENIKVIGIKDGVLSYQHIRGNKRAVEISTEVDENYMTLKNFLEEYKIKGDKTEIEKIKEQVKKSRGHSRLFYSTKGIIKEYEVDYLKRVVSGEEYGILEKLKKFGRK